MQDNTIMRSIRPARLNSMSNIIKVDVAYDDDEQQDQTWSIILQEIAEEVFASFHLCDLN